MKIGHNNPPSLIDHANETGAALSEWMATHPVIQTEEDAREAKILCDRAKDAKAEMENERTTLVRPFNEKVREINDSYREPRNSLDRVLEVLVSRLDAFAKLEERRRLALAEEARQRMAEAERAARDAESAEKDAIDSASHGELDIDVSQATSRADAAFDLFKQARREAVLAERDSKVKIGGGFRKPMGFKKTETLEVADWVEVLNFLGVTDRIRDAILTEARAFRQQHGDLPPGITASYTRDMK